MQEKIAIIGGGVAGLTAGYLLSQKYKITLFEKSNRIGGNAYTYHSRDGHEVDIAVAAFGKAGYPNFYKLLSKLNIKTELCLNSYMSFHDLETNKGIYLTPSLKGLLTQHFQVFNTKKLWNLFCLIQGINKGQALLAKGELNNQTLKQALEKIPQLSGEAQIIFLCALCLLSSMSAREILAAPAPFFFNKLKIHHDVLSPKAVYSVRAIKNRTQSYIKALANPYQEDIVFHAKIKTVLRTNKICLVFSNGKKEVFDKVVFACHADQALQLIHAPSKEEKNLLGSWQYKEGRVTLHRDYTSFPKKSLMQAYTFLYTLKGGILNTSVNGSLWYEPGVSKSCDLISSQHPNFPINKKKVEFDTVLRTPLFDFNSYSTIKKLPSLNGNKNTYYCGSYFGYGLHEDAVSSAIDVAQMLGVEF